MNNIQNQLYTKHKIKSKDLKLQINYQQKINII